MTPKPGAPPRVLSVIGTRPEGIKLAPVVRALRGYDDLDSRVLLTGQHTDMLDAVIELFDLRPDYDLSIMREGQDLHDVTIACLDGLRPVMTEFQPHIVLVQGDTASAFVASLSAFYHRAQVGHVEAGLRSGRKRTPFPEEVFRRLAGVIADHHFAPTRRAVDNLRHEGVPPDSIYLTGNTVVDALHWVARSSVRVEHPTIARLLNAAVPIVLVTVHRRESFGAVIEALLASLRDLAEAHPHVQFVFPVHPNPNVAAPAQRLLSNRSNIHLVAPLPYVDLIRTLEHATLVLTDSGGIQEEAPSFGVPVFVLREVTERPEGIEAGVVHLIGTDPAKLKNAVSRQLKVAARATRRPTAAVSPYGDGRAGERIADVLHHALTGAVRTTEDWASPPVPSAGVPAMVVQITGSSG